MRTAEEIVKALRCSSTAHLPGEETDCKNCPYSFREEPDEDVKRQYADVPAYFWDMCNCDSICMDAAEMIERLVNDKSAM